MNGNPPCHLGGRAEGRLRAVFFLCWRGFIMRAIVYVDGFNLYYGAVKGTPHRWLDLGKLFKFLLPRDHIVRIRYFTGPIPKSGRDRPISVPESAMRK